MFGKERKPSPEALRFAEAIKPFLMFMEANRFDGPIVTMARVAEARRDLGSKEVEVRRCVLLRGRQGLREWLFAGEPLKNLNGLWNLWEPREWDEKMWSRWSGRSLDTKDFISSDLLGVGVRVGWQTRGRPKSLDILVKKPTTDEEIRMAGPQGLFMVLRDDEFAGRKMGVPNPSPDIVSAKVDEFLQEIGLLPAASPVAE